MLFRWVCGRAILYMHRSYEAVTRRLCHDVAVIWLGTPKCQPKISLRWWRGQGSLAGNIGSRIMLVVESWFKFATSEGSRTTIM